MTRPRSTYHADCLCGKPITSETRETKCEDCGRWIFFEWGGDIGFTLHTRCVDCGAYLTQSERRVQGQEEKEKGASA